MSDSDRLDVVEANLREVHDAITEVMDAVGQIQTSVTKLTAGGAGSKGEGGGTTWPTSWADTATAEDWEDLIDWVDRFLLTYELTEIPPCWPAHGGVVEELAALRGAWRVLMWRTDGKTAPQDIETPAQWHDRIMVPTLHRIENSYYPVRSCREGHRTPAPARPADRSFITLSPTAPASRQTSGEQPGPATSAEEA